MEFKLATHRSNEMKPEVIKMLPKNYFKKERLVGTGYVNIL